MSASLQLSMRRAGVAQVLMNRPEVFNAFDEQMIGDLDAAFEKLSADPAVRVIVLAGEGKHFSAGADLQWMQRASKAGHEWNLNDARRFADMLARIGSCPKPTLARVQGAALGGGVGLVCACDMAICDSTASFSVSEARFGILPAVIGPYVTNAVGKRHAKRMALSTARIGSEEARLIGLVHQSVKPDELDTAVDAFAKELLIGGPIAQHEIKTLFAQLQVGQITPEVRELTAQTIARVRSTPEAREGFEAFLGKRTAAWNPA